MSRLRRADPSVAGCSRRRRGRGFQYLDADGNRIEDESVLERVRALRIPPAWNEVWISPDPLGHLQATGLDAAGRKQYLYHPRWRERRDREKFDRMLLFAELLPGLREQARRDLSRESLDRPRILACAARLLDRGFFRVGSEDYAEENGTYGLATMKKQHVRLGDGNTITFDYVAKGRKRRVQSIVDRDLYDLVSSLKRRRGGGEELLAYREGRLWVDVRSADINDYIRSAAGGDFTAKDFRTWNATVLAAVSLAVASGAAQSKSARKRAEMLAVKEVAHYLGNTPAVCRASYIDPRVFDRFNAGVTISGVVEHLGSDPTSAPEAQAAIDEAVRALLQGDIEVESDGLRLAA